VKRLKGKQHLRASCRCITRCLTHLVPLPCSTTRPAIAARMEPPSSALATGTTHSTPTTHTTHHNNPEIRGGSQRKYPPKPPQDPRSRPPSCTSIDSSSRNPAGCLSLLAVSKRSTIYFLARLASWCSYRASTALSKPKKRWGGGVPPPAPPPPPLRDGCAAARRTGWAAPNPQSNGYFEPKPQSNGHFDQKCRFRLFVPLCPP
jgi:hypothetical protein